MLKISIVTPNFNYGHFLESTLLSVLDQNYPNLEYIVKDGRSTDNSVDIIMRYVDKIAHWESAPDKGMYAAINEGLNSSSGQIMGWLNSDDMHLPWTLRAVGDIFAAFPEVDWITTYQPAYWDYHGMLIGLDRIDGFSGEAFLDGRYFTPLTKRPTDIQKSIPLQGCLQQESTFWRRSLWERAGGYLSQDFGVAGDFELWSRFIQHAEPYGVSIPLAGFRLQHQQQTAQRSKYGDDSLKALRMAREACGWKRKRMREWVFRWRLRRPTRWLARYRYTGKSIVRHNHDRPDACWRIESNSFF